MQIATNVTNFWQDVTKYRDKISQTYDKHDINIVCHKVYKWKWPQIFDKMSQKYDKMSQKMWQNFIKLWQNVTKIGQKNYLNSKRCHTFYKENNEFHCNKWLDVCLTYKRSVNKTNKNWVNWGKKCKQTAEIYLEFVVTFVTNNAL